MSREKSKREYSVVLKNKTLGDFYFKYYNYYKRAYVFSKPTRIAKWKSTKIPLELCQEIFDNLKKNEYKILLSCTDLVNSGAIDINHPDLIKDRNRYYFVITKVGLPDTDKNKIKFDIERYSITIKDSCDAIKNCLDSDFLDVTSVHKNVKLIEKYVKDIATYKNWLESQLDVIDVSFNFRYIKMKILNSLSSEED